MNFIGLIWLASYVSSFFSSHNLLKTPEYITRLFLSKVEPVQAPSVPDSADRSGPVPPKLHLASHVSSLPLHQSSRTQIPLIQSFLHPFSWLPFTEGAALQFDWTHSLTSFSSHALSQSSSSSTSNSVTLLMALANIAPWTNLAFREPHSKETSGQITRLVANLSRWSQKIGQAMPLVPTIAVTHANRSTDITSSESLVNATLRSCLPPQFRDSDASESSFQVRVQGRVIAELPSQGQADAFAQRLKQVLRHPEFSPTSLKPAIAKETYLVKAANEVLFTIDSQLERSLHRTGDLIAIDWINNLRTALNAPSLSLTEAQAQMHSLVQTGQTLSGIASWYGPYFHGRLTAAGEIFDQNELTAAHPSLPFDTYLKVTNLKNGNTVIVRINDRGPYVGERSLDLSRTAARCLGSEDIGVIPYEALVLEAGIIPNQPQPESPSSNGAIARQP